MTRLTRDWISHIQHGEKRGPSQFEAGKAWRCLLACVIIATQSVGCTSMHEARPNVLIASSRFFSSNAIISDDCVFVAVDESPPQAQAMVRLPEGPHTLRTSVSWSNGYTEIMDLNLLVIENERYVIYAVERSAKQKPTDIQIRPKTTREKLWNESTEAFFWGFGPFWFPFTLARGAADAAQNQQVSDRPFDGCCFIWAAEANSGRIVAGSPPPSK
ncbi:MAG: hypothetical protein Q8O35_03180 [Humidesulfovibrio sp.]|jgi:hypothetical protein|uniref:hypothetical protein n=1 Tax=Humidesulfovibrio sp. TaxID=2910988 RepID=UPI00273544AA|nr:hypothetical protein [Humidesulfovibrio sp.]MDP2847180.1 hypothetical protein [Humidesulfovibrio sp.]